VNRQNSKEAYNLVSRQLLTIPVSGTVKIGLLKAAIKKAGLTEEEFAQWL
jgi:hypothetical protein